VADGGASTAGGGGAAFLRKKLNIPVLSLRVMPSQRKTSTLKDANERLSFAQAAALVNRLADSLAD